MGTICQDFHQRDDSCLLPNHGCDEYHSLQMISDWSRLYVGQPCQYPKDGVYFTDNEKSNRLHGRIPETGASFDRERLDTKGLRMMLVVRS